MKEVIALHLVLVVLCVLEASEATIHSTEMFKKKTHHFLDFNSEWVDRTKPKNFRSRFLRAVPSSGPLLTVSVFDLKDDTTHNQALIHWSGNNSKVVFILTRKKTSSGSTKITDSTLWRSKNYGKDYTSMTSHFPKDAVLKSYFISPSDKRKVIFVDAFNGSRRIWVSTNEGETYSDISVPFFVEKIDFHPEKSDWLLGYDKLRRELYCSMNFGATWKKLGDEVTSERYYWFIKDVDTGKDAERIVHFEYRHVLLSVINRIYKVRSCYIPDCKSTPFQQKIDALENIDLDSLVVQHDYVFVQKAGAAEKLYVSYRRGPFVKALFPYYPGKAQSHFHIISSDGECVVVGVNHDNGLTHLFFSDLPGMKFRQSLSNVRYFNKKTTENKVFTVDIYEVQGITGTYVANVHNPDSSNTTKITWDNGQSWSNITTEVTDENGNALPSCFQCSLNLHLSMEQTKSGYYMQSVLAKKSSPGLIVAHGTFGRNIDDNPNNVMLFVSSDNGKSWSIARKQRHFVVITNHGGVIIAVKMIFLRPVTELVFSSDYGKTWTTYKFTDTPVNVDGILTEPGEYTSHLTLFGHKTYADSWRIFQIDVTPLFPEECKYPDDYKNITYPRMESRECHLGLVQSVERLIDGKHCLIPANYSRIITKSVCNCTMKDYECDLGYKSTITEGKISCERIRMGPIDNIGNVHLDPAFEQKVKCIDNIRNVTTGFRKVPGDRCKNDLDVFWKTEPCHEPVSIPTTKPMSRVQIQLVNKTTNAKVGENLLFSIQGVTDGAIVWHILSPKKLNRVEEVKTGAQKNLTLEAKEPGKYRVQVSLQGKHKFSNMILVEFWYPIEKVYLYHPPVVAQMGPYNASVWTQTMYGLRGNRTLLGDVSYTWDVDAKDMDPIQPSVSTENSITRRAHSKSTSVKIRVTAENTVSSQVTSGKIQVKEYIETLVLEMECQPEMRPADMNDMWLEEFTQALEQTLFRMDAFAKATEKYKLINKITLFIYVPPGENLKVHIYFAPMTGETKENLLEAAQEAEKAISEGGLVVRLTRHTIVTVKSLYIIDHDGTVRIFQPQAANSGNGAVIAVGVILAIALLVVAFFVIRCVSRKVRSDQYLHFRSLRSRSGRASHIVRNQDRSPIVDDEFIDDDLNTMEDIGSQSPTLQFQG